jgi:hypothetical protein
MNVNATLDGEDVVIVSMEKQRLTAFITYIDAQGGPGNLKIAEIPLTDLPLGLATGSEVVPSAPPWPSVGTTFDPVNKGSNTIISGGNLVATCGNAQSVARSIGTIAEGSKTIFEFTHTADTWPYDPPFSQFCRMGFGTADCPLDVGVGYETSTSLAIQSDGSVNYNGGEGGSGGSLPEGFGVGDTITLELERSGGNAIVTFYKNGSYLGIRTQAMPGGVWHAMVSNTVPVFTGTYTANFLGPYQIEPTAGYGPIPV